MTRGIQAEIRVRIPLFVVDRVVRMTWHKPFILHLYIPFLSRVLWGWWLRMLSASIFYHWPIFVPPVCHSVDWPIFSLIRSLSGCDISQFSKSSRKRICHFPESQSLLLMSAHQLLLLSTEHIGRFFFLSLLPWLYKFDVLSWFKVVTAKWKLFKWQKWNLSYII